ncbi:DUF1853 family protein [Microbulbifer sp. ANSA001]|uniref:DUF1853 family protein n=1 Tax=Microbulbifer sp. ANSA001 TaxID=3243358 RepID=UPI0040423A25
MSQIFPSAPVDHWSNLLWAVGSPGITGSLESSFLPTTLPWLPEKRRERLLEYFAQSQVNKKLSPQLEAFLQHYSERKPTSRLGVYFERLWAFVFEHHPDYQLLHHNLPLRIADKTLGELDFVVRHLPSDTCEHWEVAVKFYLQLPGHFWIGPGLRDRLDIKLRRMAEHQLPLIRRPEVVYLLQDLNLKIEQQWALIPGRLFYALEGPAKARGKLSKRQMQFWWADPDSFNLYLSTFPQYQSLRWFYLSKPTWLAPLQPDLTSESHSDELPKALDKAPVDRPLCVAAKDKSGEVCRGFIVPKHWYPEALASLPGH